MNFSITLTYIKIRGDDMYPNPYMISVATKTGILSKGLSSLKAINWGGLLEGTQKTLGVINQAIPVVYQIKPIVNNAKTLFKIAGSMREDNTPAPPKETKVPQPQKEVQPKNAPIFYI